MPKIRTTIRKALHHPAFFWSVVLIALLLPADRGWAELAGTGIRVEHALATLGLLGLMIATASLIGRRRIGWWLLAAVILILFFIRILFFGLVMFSGRGFTDEFFLHFGSEAIGVAWEQYQWLFILLFTGLIGLALLIVASVRRLPQASSKVVALIVGLSLIALLTGYSTLPEWRLAAATDKWFGTHDFHIPAERLALWQKSPLIHLSPPSKDTLVAKPASTPKNLILLYIESGGLTLVESPRYPDLMPNLRRLVDQHSLVDHLHASSYITIEGIVNSMCGTLFPFEQGSDWMASSENLADNLPCLGDVLQAAGYQQSFLGGADKGFAGKGAFLTAHGYDKVMGIYDWMEQGLYQPEGMWGLSDADLFEQSFEELKALKASGKPYNLTLLTIGTHLPGFLYKECQPYRDGKESFLNAVHCTDQLITHWIERLTSEGWLDKNTTLVITGDHQIFPNPAMKLLFGEDAVTDRRLPLIVIDADAPIAKQTHGAGYDLAPTVLDLLHVDSNVVFPLGRSLLRDDSQNDYFVSRYADVIDETVVEPGQLGDCRQPVSDEVPGITPLSACQREELFTLLRAQAAQFSRAVETLNCAAKEPLEILVPEAPDQPLYFVVVGADQSIRFTHSSRRVDATSPGLFQILFDNAGHLLQRGYATATDASTAPMISTGDNTGFLLAVAWRPGSMDDLPPAWLSLDGGQGAGGAAILLLQEGKPPKLVMRSRTGEQLSLSPEICESADLR